MPHSTFFDTASQSPLSLASKLTKLAVASGADFLSDPRPVALMPTPRSTVFSDNDAKLLRFFDGQAGSGQRKPVVLLVPSMINRWYVLDLRPGASLIGYLVASGLDVYCVDWGDARDEDRYLTWDAVLARLARMVRATRRHSGQNRVGLLGYCMGATLATIHAALHPDSLTSLINLTGPIDFASAGVLRHMTDARWFDVAAIAAAGNVTPTQMQSGFTAMRPTLQVAKWVGVADRFDDLSVEAFAALETWANDNVAFPAAAYRTYITELYQDNRLIAGTHRVGGVVVDLRAITCPTLVVTASRDTICPPAAATALLGHCGASRKVALQVAGGHVGAVIGGKATRELYPHIAEFVAAGE